MQQYKTATPFIDLQRQQERIRTEIESAIRRVLDHGKYIMGPEVVELEEKLSEYCGVKHTITCSSGTDALLMMLMAKEIGPRDAVFLPSFTFPATAEVIALLGATPIFVDVDEKTYNIDHHTLVHSIKKAEQFELIPRAIIAVDLFGQPADYVELEAIAKEHGLWLFADAAQSFGASLHGNKVGTLASATATSFFPAKPLGCYGDGGAVFTDDGDLATILRSLRVHGKGKHKYDNIRTGLNARLDTIQAAILLQKLNIFSDECSAKQQIAELYNQALQHDVGIPQIIRGAVSSWAQYTIRLPQHIDRRKMISSLKELGIPTMVYYEKPLHLQDAYNRFPTSVKGAFPVSEALSHTVLSLPMSAYLSHQTIQFISSEVLKWT